MAVAGPLPENREVLWAVQIARCPPDLEPHVQRWLVAELPTWVHHFDDNVEPIALSPPPVSFQERSRPWWDSGRPAVPTVRCEFYRVAHPMASQEEMVDLAPRHAQVLDRFGSNVALAFALVDRQHGGNRIYLGAWGAVLGTAWDPLPWPTRREERWDWTALDRRSLTTGLVGPSRLHAVHFHTVAQAMFERPWPGREARESQGILESGLPAASSASRPPRF